MLGTISPPPSSIHIRLQRKSDRNQDLKGRRMESELFPTSPRLLPLPTDRSAHWGGRAMTGAGDGGLANTGAAAGTSEDSEEGDPISPGKRRRDAEIRKGQDEAALSPEKRGAHPGQTVWT